MISCLVRIVFCCNSLFGMSVVWNMRPLIGYIVVRSNCYTAQLCLAVTPWSVCMQRKGSCLKRLRNAWRKPFKWSPVLHLIIYSCLWWFSTHLYKLSLSTVIQYSIHSSAWAKVVDWPTLPSVVAWQKIFKNILTKYGKAKMQCLNQLLAEEMPNKSSMFLQLNLTF